MSFHVNPRRTKVRTWLGLWRRADSKAFSASEKLRLSNRLQPKSKAKSGFSGNRFTSLTRADLCTRGLSSLVDNWRHLVPAFQSKQWKMDSNWWPPIYSVGTSSKSDSANFALIKEQKRLIAKISLDPSINLAWLNKSETNWNCATNANCLNIRTYVQVALLSTEAGHELAGFMAGYPNIVFALASTTDLSADTTPTPSST